MIRGLIASLFFVCEIAYSNEWIFVDGDGGGLCGSAVVMNEDKSFLSVACGSTSNKCMLIMFGIDYCSGVIPSILSFDNGGVYSATAECSRDNGIGKMALFSEDQGLVFESMLSAKHIGIALPVVGGKFKSYSYVLDGYTAAVKKLHDKCSINKGNALF